MLGVTVAQPIAGAVEGTLALSLSRGAAEAHGGGGVIGRRGHDRRRGASGGLAGAVAWTRGQPVAIRVAVTSSRSGPIGVAIAQ